MARSKREIKKLHRKRQGRLEERRRNPPPAPTPETSEAKEEPRQTPKKPAHRKKEKE
jgi:hypothetical protein